MVDDLWKHMLQELPFLSSKKMVGIPLSSTAHYKYDLSFLGFKKTSEWLKIAPLQTFKQLLCIKVSEWKRGDLQREDFTFHELIKQVEERERAFTAQPFNSPLHVVATHVYSKRS